MQLTMLSTMLLKNIFIWWIKWYEKSSVVGIFADVSIHLQRYITLLCLVQVYAQFFQSISQKNIWIESEKVVRTFEIFTKTSTIELKTNRMVHPVVLSGLISDCVCYLTKGIVCYHLIKYGDLVVLNAILPCNSNKEVFFLL